MMTGLGKGGFNAGARARWG